MLRARLKSLASRSSKILEAALHDRYKAWIARGERRQAVEGPHPNKFLWVLDIPKENLDDTPPFATLPLRSGSARTICRCAGVARTSASTRFDCAIDRRSPRESKAFSPSCLLNESLVLQGLAPPVLRPRHNQPISKPSASR